MLIKTCFQYINNIDCLFIYKVDSQKSKSMRSKEFENQTALRLRESEIYRLYKLEGIEKSVIMEKMGISRSTFTRSISNFERNNPQLAEQMKKERKDVVPEDYKALLKEINELKKSLAQERLRADFYEEMVAFGKEVYGIDLKKAGTK